MFMEDEKEGKTLPFFFAREKETKAVFRSGSEGRFTAGSEKSDWSSWTSSKMPPALTSLIESWSNLRAMKGGSRMTAESSPVGSSEGTGIVEKAIQSVQV